MVEVTSPSSAPQAPVLDYAAPAKSWWWHLAQVLRDAGPWWVWPSKWTAVWFAFLLLSALWLARMPRNWSVIAELPAQEGPQGIAGTNRVLYRALDYTLRVREIIDGAGGDREIQLESSPTHTEPVASADGSRVLGVGADELVFWDAHSGKMLGQFRKAWLNFKTPCSDFAISPGGERLAVCYARGAAAVWDVSDPQRPQLIRALSEDGALDLTTPKFSPDGRNLLLSNGRTVWLGDAQMLEQKLKVTRSSWNYVQASWSSDGKRLALAARAEHSWDWTISIIDPDAPDSPLVQIPHRADYVYKLEHSQDDRLLVFNRRVFALPSGRKLASFDEHWFVDSVVPGTRLILSNDFWPFSQLVDLVSGDVLATLSDRAGYTLLADGRTLASRTSMGRIQIVRQFAPGPEKPAIRSIRLWLMLPLALMLAISLCRDGSRRSRIKPGRIDTCAAAVMILAGVACFTWGLAQTAVERSIGEHTWWSANWTVYPALGCLCCGMGVLAGSRGWLWITRLAMVFVITLSLINAVSIPSPMGLIVLDLLWIVPAWFPRAWCIGCAVLALVTLVLLGLRTKRFATPPPAA